MPKIGFKTITISIDNYEFIMAIAAKITDETGAPLSANTGVNRLRKIYEETV